MHPFLLPVALHMGHGAGADGHHPFLVALAHHTDITVLEIRPADAQPAKLAYPQPYNTSNMARSRWASSRLMSMAAAMASVPPAR